MSSLILDEFVSTLLGVFAMGTSCGTGCSPIIAMFLTTYIIDNESDTKKTFKAYLKFFIGKALSVIIICLLASITGKIFVSDNKYFEKYKVDYIMPIFLISMGVYMSIKIYKSKKACKGCKSCNSNKFDKNATMLGGFLYGITPCAPLVFLVAGAACLPIYKALILAIVFAIASCISPLIIIMVFTKLIIDNMKEEVPKMLIWVQLIFSVILIFTGSYYLVKCFV